MESTENNEITIEIARERQRPYNKIPYENPTIQNHEKNK